MNRIKELRKAKGISTVQLGKYLGLTNATITNYENGRRNPTPATLIKLADYFNVTVDYLIGRDDNSPEAIAATPHTQLKQLAVTMPATDETSKTVRGFLKFNFWERLQLPKAFRKLLKEHDNVVFLDKYIDGNDKLYEGYFWLDRSAGDKIAVIGEDLTTLKRDFIATVNERFAGGAK